MSRPARVTSHNHETGESVQFEQATAEDEEEAIAQVKREFAATDRDDFEEFRVVYEETASVRQADPDLTIYVVRASKPYPDWMA